VTTIQITVLWDVTQYNIDVSEVPGNHDDGGGKIPR